MKITRTLVATGLIALMAFGCGKEEDETSDAEALETITLTGSLKLADTGLTALPALSELVLYCTSFSSAPSAASAEFGTDGSFSLDLPAGVPFGCFVNNKTSNATVGMFVFETGIESGLGGSTASSAALAASLNLGELTLSETGLITIPAATLASAKSEITASGIDLDLVHNQGYQMECIDTGNAANLAACNSMINEDDNAGKVFFRILKGTEGGNDVRGLGVWANKEAFEACGGFDMTTAEVSNIEAEENIEFSSISTGEAFTVGDSCELRNPDDSAGSYNLSNLFAQSKLNQTAAGYSFYSEDEEEYEGGCYSYHSTGIEFTGTADEIYGSFTNVEVRKGCSDEDNDSKSMFSIKFIKQ